MVGSSWAHPVDLVMQVQRLWDRGRLLACAVPMREPSDGAGDNLEFPLRLRFRKPTPRELGPSFVNVQLWIDALEEVSRSKIGHGYEIMWEETNNRQLGRNKVPLGVRLPTRADALALIGRTQEAARFDALVAATLARFPALRDWLARKPLVALEHEDDWGRILDCLAWFRDHPRSGVYARQIDVAGVDTKFIEARKTLLAELLDIVLPAEAIDASVGGARGFEARYGLRGKPRLLRFRILDERHAISNLTDLTVPVEEFVGLSISLARVFVVENEITGLAFPPLPDSMVVLGLGHAVSLIGGAHWLDEREVYYWSDLDTHGFAMLDRLRASFPRIRSLLMDLETLLAHRALWTTEAAPHVAPLDRLTTEEAALYADLRYDRPGRSVRLEQERISFGWLRRTLDAL
ncbi:MAG: hypothetical protein J2P51_08200 [Hyphomicrobiaceae bacterium]|nr:hypothetical protein [Hyphomicrobiaceae bacterium]